MSEDMKSPHVSSAAVQTVAERLGFQWHSQMQDWDIELAWAKDAERLIGSYHPSDPPEERVVTMRFIIAAYDDHLGTNPPVSTWEDRIRHWLINDWAIHAATVEYWSVLDPEFEDGFNVTPLMRAILNEHQN